MWVSQANDNEVSHIDPADGTVLIRLGVSGAPGAMAVGDGSVIRTAPEAKLNGIGPGCTRRLVAAAVGCGALRFTSTIERFGTLCDERGG